MGIWRIKNKILAKKDDVKIFFESSYNLFRTNPLDKTSSDIPVAKATSTRLKNFVDPNIWNSSFEIDPVLANLRIIADEKKKIPIIIPIEESVKNFFLSNQIASRKGFFSRFFIYKITGSTKINGFAINSSNHSGR